jgi:hypothetical protein
METKEEWIMKTMESLDGINRAECDPGMTEKLLKQTLYQEPFLIPIRPGMVWRAAALILVLISFNIFTLVWAAGKSDHGQYAVKSVANEYFSYIDSINL